MAVTQNITAEQGAALSVTFTGATASLSGRSLRMHVRAKVGNASTKLVASTTDGRLSVGADPYTTATLTVGSDIMAALSITDPIEYWVYDVESYTSATDVRREWEGRFTISRDVTRDTEATLEDGAAGYVRYDSPQTLTDAQKLQARENIGAGTGGSGGAWGSITGTLSDQTDLQAALDAKQAASATLTTLSSATAAGLALMDDADAAAQRTTLGLGSAATAATGDFEPAGAVSTHVGLPDPHTQYALESSLGGAALLNVGTTTGTVAAGDDSRFTDSRTPTAHASTHATAGSDPIAPADIGAAAASHTHAASDITSGTLDAARLPAATTSASGAVELATQAEVDAGSDTSRVLTPATNRGQTPPYVEWGASADKTLALSDANLDQWCNNGATARVLNIPLNSSVAFPTGTKIPVLKLGSGTCTIDAATGVTLNGVDGGSTTISTQYQGALLSKTGTDAWIISGDVGTVA